MTFNVHTDDIDIEDVTLTLDEIKQFEYQDELRSISDSRSTFACFALCEVALDHSDFQAFTATLEALAINASYTHTFSTDSYVEVEMTFVYTRVS